MNHIIDQAYSKLFKWAEQNPQAHTIPGHIQSEIDKINRHDQASMLDVDRLLDHGEADLLQQEIETKTAEYAYRRNLEHSLADYIHDVADQTGRLDLYQVSNKLSSCRMSGTYGQRPDGGLIIAWDTKCGFVRLCPDESREETQRIDNFYNPAIIEFANAHPTHRVFSSVFTTHNYRPGNLATGKREIFDEFKIFIKQFPNIKGCLVVQEDPLSVNDDWNVHLNVIFLVKGRFDWNEIREAWGQHLWIKEVGKDGQSVGAAIRELVKYNTLIVGQKSEEKADQGKSDAPGMLEWKPDRWCEWWDAQQGFRRTRSYGCLYALHGKRWNDSSIEARKKICQDAGLDEKQTRRYSKQLWNKVGLDLPGIPDLSKKDREKLKVKLRKAIVHGEPALDMHSIHWLGSIEWAGSSYWVSLIPADNFSGYRGHKSGRDNFNTGPPPDF